MRNRKTYANLTKISLEFPDTNPLSQLTQVYLKTALIAALYHAGKLSSKQACTVLGISRRQFEKLSACHSRVDMP
ncbi:MAG: hypothetical protein GY862_18165 [Gammaproteobacteria bacterium]|nr:hypothetical protein [Gammaproteobacteria bacterium]